MHMPRHTETVHETVGCEKIKNLGNENALLQNLLNNTQHIAGLLSFIFLQQGKGKKAFVGVKKVRKRRTKKQVPKQQGSERNIIISC